MVKDTYQEFLRYSRNLLDYDFEKESISGFGPETNKEWAMYRLILLLMQNMGEYDANIQKFNKAIEWLGMDLGISTDIAWAKTVTIDDFLVQLLYPDNLYAREISHEYNPNGIHTNQLLEIFKTTNDHHTAINLYYTVTGIDFDDMIEYLRFTLIGPHSLITPTDSELGYSLENGIIMTILILKRIITPKTLIR